MGDVVHAAGDEIVHADDGMAFADKTVAQMRPQKTGRAGNEYAHCCSPITVGDSRPNVGRHFTPAPVYGRIGERGIIPTHE